MALPPKKSKQDGRDNSAPNQGSGTSHGPNTPRGFFSADALDVSGGLIFLVVGGGFHYAGGWFHIIGFLFDFLVVCCGLTVITHHVDEQIFKRFGLRYWLSLIVAFIIFASLAGYVVWKENDHPLPTNPAGSKPVKTAIWQPAPLGYSVTANTVHLTFHGQDLSFACIARYATLGLWPLVAPCQWSNTGRAFVYLLD